MGKYKISFVSTIRGDYYVEASSVEEAIKRSREVRSENGANIEREVYRSARKALIERLGKHGFDLKSSSWKSRAPKEVKWRGGHVCSPEAVFGTDISTDPSDAKSETVKQP